MINTRKRSKLGLKPKDVQQFVADVETGRPEDDLKRKYRISTGAVQVHKSAARDIIDRRERELEKPKKRVVASEVLADIRTGMGDSPLMKKYGLSPTQLRSLYGKLLEAKMISPRELALANRTAPRNKKADRQSSSSPDQPDDAEKDPSPQQTNMPRFLSRHLKARPAETTGNSRTSIPAAMTANTGTPEIAEPGPRFRIKLYGHTSRNIPNFVKNLAILLETDIDSAYDRLRRVPTVIAEGLPQARAGSLMAALKLIGALCILESPDGAEAPDLGESIGNDLLAVQQDKEKKKKATPPMQRRVLTGSLLGTSLVAVAMVLLLMLTAIRHDPDGSSKRIVVAEPFGVVATQSGPAIDQLREGALPVKPGKEELELKEALADLKQKNEKLQLTLRTGHQELVQLYNTSFFDMERAQEKRHEVMVIREVIGTNMREIEDLNRAITVLARSRKDRS
ncbi:hypothetical protein ACFL2Q_11415 [Thermodesulfobacteriota bacterium]